MENYNIYNNHHPSFQVDSEIVRDAYSNLDNYLIIKEKPAVIKTRAVCAIYFSGNGIYFPNDEETFRNNIINKNRFEWYGNRFKNVTKHIFLRDVHKQWYLSGINNTINSPNKLLNFLRKQTAGFDIICIGSSAGGYASILFGSLLGAKKIYAFSPQLELYSLIKTEEVRNPLIVRLKDTERSIFYDIVKFMGDSPASIYIFLPLKSKWDIQQWEYAKSKRVNEMDNIHTIFFNSSTHGVPFPSFALEAILATSMDNLVQFENRINRPFVFSISQIGLWKTIGGYYKNYKKSLFIRGSKYITLIKKKLNIKLCIL